MCRFPCSVEKNIYTGNMSQTKALKKHPKKYHHGDLKSALVAAGIEILETEGLPGLSLRAIAARVGVSHTAPKNHFGSLKGLLTAIGTEGFCRHATAMRDGVSDTSPGPERLKAAAAGYVAFAEAHPALFELMFSPLYCNFDDEALIAAARKSYAVLTDIATGLDWDKADLPDGQLRTEMMLWSMVHGYAVLKSAGQFRTGTTTGEVYPISDVMPAFGYRLK